VLRWRAGKETSMGRKQAVAAKEPRRDYTDEFKREAVQMLLDGLKPKSIAERLGLPRTNLLHRWKQQQLERSGPVASSLEARVRELESELHRVERERDILKKALAIFGRHE
jgi:transposase